MRPAPATGILAIRFCSVIFFYPGARIAQFGLPLGRREFPPTIEARIVKTNGGPVNVIHWAKVD
jgi:hypothetical protein